MYSVRVVRSFARFGIVAGLGNSFIVRNVVFLCSHFGWQFNEFVQGKICLQHTRFLSHFYDQVTQVADYDVHLSYCWIS